YSRQDWAKVIWSDECYVQLGDHKGRVYITRCPDKPLLEQCTVPTFKQSPVCVIVWRCIMDGEKGPLIVLEYPGGKGGGMTSARYQEQVLEGGFFHHYQDMKKKKGSIYFQQDRAPSHTSKITKDWL
ncbi:hypothetical protein BJ165DRAFT_1318752, partial [Panaeolus papilionaceus]